MSHTRRIFWFVALYVASIAAFALVTLSIRGLLQLAQGLAS